MFESNGTPRPTAVVLQTHFLNRTIARQFRRLTTACPPHYSCFLLIHMPPGSAKPEQLDSVPHHFVTTPEIRCAEYPVKSGGGKEWNFWDGGHTDLVWLHFARAHPEFERVWIIEYDVRFNGHWSRLFNAFEHNDADFLTTSLLTAATNPRWIYWPNALTPPDHTPLPAEADRIRGFLPILRVSRAALNEVDAAYRAGWGGHCEATWPTLIHRAGLRIEDIGDDGPFVSPSNRGRFYSSTPETWNHAPGTFVFKPAKHFIRWRRNYLYHPVKPLNVTLREDWRRVVAKYQLIQRRMLDIVPPQRGDRLPRI